jgi:hypothetical protein
MPNVFSRPILLDGGKRKNALFLLTQHLQGLMLINTLAWKFTNDGMCLLASQFAPKGHGQQTLFDIPKEQFKDHMDAQKHLEQIIISKFKTKQRLSNADIITITAVTGFLPKHANEIVKKLEKNKFLRKLGYRNAKKRRGFYIAEEHWNTVLCLLEYRKGGENNAND